MQSAGLGKKPSSEHCDDPGDEVLPGGWVLDVVLVGPVGGR